MQMLTADRLNDAYRDREKFGRQIRQLSGWLGRPIQVGGDRTQSDLVRLVEVDDNGKRKLRLVLTDAGVAAAAKKLRISLETVPAGVVAQGSGVLVQRRGKLPNGRVVDAYGKAEGSDAAAIMRATAAANRAVVYQHLGIGLTEVKREVPMDFVTRDWVHNPSRRQEKAVPARVLVQEAKSPAVTPPPPPQPEAPAQRLQLTLPAERVSQELTTMCTPNDVAEIKRAAAARGLTAQEEVMAKISAALPETRGCPLPRLSMDEATYVMSALDEIFGSQAASGVAEGMAGQQEVEPF